VRASVRSAVSRLYLPVDAASLAVFRIGFGLLLLVEILVYTLGGRIHRYFEAPAFHFTYFGWGWVRPLPETWMVALFVVLGVAAALVALGLFYRVAAVVFFLGFAYVFLLERALYLNHFYLVILLSGLLVVVPAHRALSLDARRRGEASVPRWTVWLLRAQLGLVYFLAGVAKLNPDWLHAQPLRIWLAERASLPVVGALVGHPWTPWIFSYGGLALDLAAWPLLAWRRTRVAVFAVLIAFHLTNAVVFQIGIFPWLMIAATTLFFEPDWPRRFLGRPAPTEPAASLPSPRRRALTVGFVAAWLSFQALFPLRHWLYPGSVHWTEQGHEFSWHMKLRDKRSEVSFHVTDPATGDEWLIDPSAELTSWQMNAMGGRPDLIWQYARHLAESFRAKGHSRVEVRATAKVSLNGRPDELLVDPRVDLASQALGFRPASWIQPLANPAAAH
jgi:vitamin K-dependent gamma-carboxylase-like protein